MVSVAYCQSDPDYRREPGENQSSLKHILVSPAHYQASKRRRFAATINMEIGSAVHCKTLEGDEEFENRYTVKPDGINLRTKEGLDWKASIGKKTALPNTGNERAWDSVVGMTDTLRKMDWFNPDQPDYRKYNEVSFYWEADNIPCKARLDRVVVQKDEVLVLDLKTTDSIDFTTFNKKVVGGLNYLFQAAWYAEAASLAYDKPARFIFIGIERQEPWSAGIFEVSSEMLQEGKEQIRYARKSLSDCLKTKQWPAPQINSYTLDLPKWYVSPLDATTDQQVFEALF
jgi:AMMECR1 domain-containing protein